MTHTYNTHPSLSLSAHMLDCCLTLVVKHTHRTITLVVGHTGPEGAVDWDLEVVCSQPVSMCVWVGEETPLDGEKGWRTKSENK